MESYICLPGGNDKGKTVHCSRAKYTIFYAYCLLHACHFRSSYHKLHTTYNSFVHMFMPMGLSSVPLVLLPHALTSWLTDVVDGCLYHGLVRWCNLLKLVKDKLD
jgi:hypothetical protein